MRKKADSSLVQTHFRNDSSGERSRHQRSAGLSLTPESQFNAGLHSYFA
nr:MAG TPA: hypothetical protein [Bacteriophage sp.]